MSPFGLFNKKPVIEGELGYFGLGDWWLATFTPEERDYIERIYKPIEVGGGDNQKPLTQGKILTTSETAVKLLAGLAGWFDKPKDISIATRILTKAEGLSSANVLDRHFLYQQMIETYYRARDTSPDALDNAIAACQKQIDIAPSAAKAFKKEYSAQEAERTFGARLPAHVGYTQLAIIRDKQKKYEEALHMCRQAKQQGWNGDWDKRIARYEERLRKQQA